MDDDCYLPWNVRQMPDLTRRASLSASEGDPEPLRNGVDRPVDGADNGWTRAIGSWVQYAFDQPERVRQLRFVFDSDLNRPGHNSVSNYPRNLPPQRVPATMTRALRVEALDADGRWVTVARLDNNYHRLVRLPVDVTTRAVRVIPEATWGSERVHLFAWDVR